MGRAAHYRFRQAWHIAAAPDDVYAALADPAAYPVWWRQVRSVSRLGETTGTMRCRSLLPYDLVIVGVREIEDAASRTLRVRLTGDLTGWSGWQVSPDGRGTVAVFEQDVVVEKRSVRLMGYVARPVLRFNHAVMMRSGERSLGRYLRESPVPIGAPILAD